MRGRCQRVRQDAGGLNLAVPTKLRQGRFTRQGSLYERGDTDFQSPDGDRTCVRGFLGPDAGRFAQAADADCGYATCTDMCCDDCMSCGECCDCCGYGHCTAIWAEFLFLHPTGADVAHAQQQNGTGGAGTVPFGVIGTADPHYEPGFRLGAIINLSPCSSLVASYFVLRKRRGQHRGGADRPRRRRRGGIAGAPSRRWHHLVGRPGRLDV